jgi:hypothetical protein
MRLSERDILSTIGVDESSFKRNQLCSTTLVTGKQIMLNLVTDELSRRVNRFRDDHERSTAKLLLRLDQLEAEVSQLRSRASVMQRLLISKNLLTAEEIAIALTEVSELFPEKPRPEGEDHPA